MSATAEVDDLASSWRTAAGDADSHVVLHVPHGATSIPKHVRSRLLLSDPELEAELAAMTDSGTTELADLAAARADRRPWLFANRLSRLVVDPERFPDEREVMQSVGMAAVYTRTSQGPQLRKHDEVRDQELLDHYFHPYATALTTLVEQRLQELRLVVLLDVHSYPKEPLPYEIHPHDQRPEICLAPTLPTRRPGSSTLLGRRTKASRSRSTSRSMAPTSPCATTSVNRGCTP